MYSQTETRNILQNFDGKTRSNVLRVLDVYKETVRDSEYCLGFDVDESSRFGYGNKTLSTIYCNLQGEEGYDLN
jgi:hypothetical protein